jgi:hypothetical protein
MVLNSLHSVDSDPEEEILPSSENTDIIGRSAATYISENEDDRIPNEGDMDNTILSDSTASSPAPDAQSKSNANHRHTIVSLINPNNEDPYSHQRYTSELIAQNLEPVQVPVWVRGCNCKP